MQNTEQSLKTCMQQTFIHKVTKIKQKNKTYSATLRENPFKYTITCNFLEKIILQIHIFKK